MIWARIKITLMILLFNLRKPTTQLHKCKIKSEMMSSTRLKSMTESHHTGMNRNTENWVQISNLLVDLMAKIIQTMMRSSILQHGVMKMNKVATKRTNVRLIKMMNWIICVIKLRIHSKLTSRLSKKQFLKKLVRKENSPSSSLIIMITPTLSHKLSRKRRQKRDVRRRNSKELLKKR